MSMILVRCASDFLSFNLSIQIKIETNVLMCNVQLQNTNKLWYHIIHNDHTGPYTPQLKLPNFVKTGDHIRYIIQRLWLLQ